jgi:hypothetical protein
MPPSLPPRKPRPVYNLFFQEERAKLLGISAVELDERKSKEPETKRKHRKTHGKVSFQDLSKHISNKWQSMPEEEKDVYKAIYRRNMKAYKEEMETYKKLALKSAQKGHSPLPKFLPNHGPSLLVERGDYQTICAPRISSNEKMWGIKASPIKKCHGGKKSTRKLLKEHENALYCCLLILAP